MIMPNDTAAHNQLYYPELYVQVRDLFRDSDAEWSNDQLRDELLRKLPGAPRRRLLERVAHTTGLLRDAGYVTRREVLTKKKTTKYLYRKCST